MAMTGSCLSDRQCNIQDVVKQDRFGSKSLHIVPTLGQKYLPTAAKVVIPDLCCK